MATWRAQCWLGSESGYQNLEVESNTFQGAEQQLRRIYGAKQIINLREVRSDGSSSSIADIGGMLMLGAVLFVIWLFVEYFWIMTPLTVIILIAWIYKKFSE
jgi:hypothetical protein